MLIIDRHESSKPASPVRMKVAKMRSNILTKKATILSIKNIWPILENNLFT